VRIIENKNINQKQNRVQVDDKHSAENSGVNQDKTIEEKEEKEEKKE
jgi:hypothetical protein